MSDDLKSFTAWEPLLKARPTKDLSDHKRLAHIGSKLQGKKAKNLSFTTAYPGQEGERKYLGTVEGNQQFLLGYGNPKFHLAPYHWQIIDPSLSDEEAEKLHLAVGHPSKPELWTLEDEVEDEGDTEEGTPHDDIADMYDAKRQEEEREKDATTVRCGAGTYHAVPSEQMVYGMHNAHKYRWSLLRSSFFAATNPEVAEKMEQRYAMEKSLLRKRGPSTPGYDEVPSDIRPGRRDVVRDGETYRVVVSR